MTPVPKFNDIVNVADFYGLLSDFTIYVCLILMAITVLFMIALLVRIPLLWIARYVADHPIKTGVAVARMKSSK